MKRLLLFVALCAFGGCSKPPVAADTPPPHVVQWTLPIPVIIREWTELLGTVQPLPERGARISARIDGHVLSVLQGVAEGDLIEKDTIIAQLDPSIAKANLDKLKALRESAEAEEKPARSDLELAKKRYAAIKDISMIPALQKDEARIAVELADSKVAAAEKRLEVAKKEEHAAEVQLQFFTVKAPITGRLGKIMVLPGQQVPLGTVIADIVDVDKAVDVLCYVPQNVVRKLAKDQQALVGGVEPGSATGGAKGRVEFISDTAEPDSGNFAVKVRFPNSASSADKLRAGTALRIRILTGKATESLSIPDTALLEDTEPPTVVIAEAPEVVKDKEGKESTIAKARRLTVKIGLRDRVLGQVEVISVDDPEKKWKGELKDALFVTTKNQGLQTGDPLKKEEEEP